MEIIRRIIFYIFFITYLILCPLLILYSLGYIVYPFKEKLIHTGVIHLSSWPPDAQIFLERSRYKERTPATIRDLLPGEYTIRLELKGHHAWSHKVVVEDGKAAAFDGIFLIPNNWSSKAISEGSFRDLMPLTGTDYFLLSQGEQLKDHYLYDWKKGSLQPFLKLNPDLADLRLSAVFSREESKALLLLGGALWDRKYLFAQLTGQGVQIRDISKLITERPMNMEWDPDSHDSIFALYEGHVDRLDTMSAALYPKYIEGIRGWGIAREQIFVIDQNNNVVASPISKKDFKIVSENRELANILAREKDFYEIKPVTSDIMIFLGTRSTVILNHARSYFINEAAIGMRHDPDNQKILLWTRKAIGIVDLSAEDEIPSSEARGAKIRWVFNQGKDIRQCFWAHEGSHVIFRDGNTVFLLEPEPQGPAHVEPVTVSKENASVAYVEAKGVIYYLGAQDGKFYALDIGSQKRGGQKTVREEPAARKDGL